MPLQREIAEAATGRWKTEMFQSPCERPDCCVYGCCCTCCAVYQQRDELLNITGEPYVCCAGLCPCGPLGDPQDKSCLFVEACCCTGWALSGNRFMIQTRFDKENTPCDDCILWGTCIFATVISILRCFMDLPDELEMCADCLIMSVNGCMHAQQAIEIEEVKKTGYRGPNPNLLAALPPKQQAMIQEHCHGGGGGYNNGPAPQTMGAGGYPPQMQQMGGIQVQCGGCRQIFGSPQSGVTVACPHCGCHNQVP